MNIEEVKQAFERMTGVPNAWTNPALMQARNGFIQGWEAGTKAEREVIATEWWMCVQSDLEHGVKSLNEKASTDWHSKHPAMAGFGVWLEERNNHDER